jgi:transcriptional regulator with XRE-family HTH domain
MVAKACGLSYQAIYNILNGAARPTDKTIKKLSDYLEN